MIISPTEFGKGCLKTPKEVRDKHYRLAAAPPLTDWSVPHKVPANVPVLSQNGSSACTAFFTASYCSILNQIENNKTEEYSRRFIYSQTSLGPNQGTYIWKAMRVPLTVGCASLDSVPDGNATEQEMLDKSLNGTARIEARTDKYAVIPRSNIDQLAQVVKDYHGFGTGFNGHDNMFDSDGIIIDWSRSDWGHCILVIGFELRNNKKYLRFRNSWSSSWGSGGDGFISEEFVNSGMMFDCYVYAVIEDLDPLTMEIILARDPKDPDPSKVYALIEDKKIKAWVPNPATLNLGQGSIWKGFDSVIQKDLSGYRNGVIQIAVSE